MSLPKEMVIFILEKFPLLLWVTLPLAVFMPLSFYWNKRQSFRKVMQAFFLGILIIFFASLPIGLFVAQAVPIDTFFRDYRDASIGYVFEFIPIGMLISSVVALFVQFRLLRKDVSKIGAST